MFQNITSNCALPNIWSVGEIAGGAQGWRGGGSDRDRDGVREREDRRTGEMARESEARPMKEAGRGYD